ncbi:MAG: multidrug effflux MFS transporter [Paenirhodobacter sp.]|uniref:multidrug effflux MFS transporter n=1 Tax=Paenirhodobacter sp. TaxID=1965326 RepID=UPI003D142DC6
MTPAPTPAAKALPLPEFVALLALLMAMVAFSIDAMLPSLPEIAASLSPENVNRAQLVLTSFVLGMGLGTFFVGPISDAIGRKVTLGGGLAIYIAAATAALWANSLEFLLIARFVQGLGASSGRIVPMALIRDLHSGPQMAKITSIIMMFFMLIPAIAPTVGGLIALQFGWRGVFGAFVLFGLVSVVWMGLRQPETLPKERRRPLVPAKLISGAAEVLGNRDVRIYTLVISLGFGQMFTLLSTAQQLYAAYGVTTTFPYWFGAGAIVAGTASLFNARFVMRLGMQRLARGGYLMQIGFSAVMLVLVLSGFVTGPQALPVLFIWVVSVFFIAGITFGNINAMAMQRMGHLAGMTASVLSAFSTVGAVMIAAPVGQMFSGSPEPLVITTLICSGLAWWLLGRTDPAA